MTHRSYTSLILILSFTLIAITAGFNVLVDPYSIFGTPRVSGLNKLKPYAGDRGRTSKVHQVMRAAPVTLIVGNSRAEMGLNPDLACWPEAKEPVFNLAVPGLTVYKQVRYAQHAIANAPVKQIFMSVDFSDFLTSGPRHDPFLWPAPEESALRLGTNAMAEPRPQFTIDRFVDRFNASVSLGALIDSVLTITLQRRQWLETRTESGFNPADGLYVPSVNSEGVGALFDLNNRKLATSLSTTQTLFNDATNWSAEFEALDRLGAQTQRDGIELVLFVSPYHSEYLLLLDAAGLWRMFEQWKKQLVRTADTHGVTLWDFSTFDAHATELVSALRDQKESLRWFWEPVHYREELGALMLSQMLAARCSDDGAAGFGVMLNRRNSAETLADIRARRDAFTKSQPAVREKVENLLKDQGFIAPRLN